MSFFFFERVNFIILYDVACMMFTTLFWPFIFHLSNKKRRRIILAEMFVPLPQNPRLVSEQVT